MHELSLALEVCRIAQEAAQPASADRILTVGVQVGDEAGVEADNLAFCLDALLSQPPFFRARSAIVRTPGDGLHLDYVEVDDDSPDH